MYWYSRLCRLSIQYRLFVRRPTDSGDVNPGCPYLIHDLGVYPCPENVALDERGSEVVREPTPIFLVILIKYLEAPFNLFDQTPTEVRENKLCFCAALI